MFGPKFEVGTANSYEIWVVGTFRGGTYGLISRPLTVSQIHIALQLSLKPEGIDPPPNTSPGSYFWVRCCETSRGVLFGGNHIFEGVLFLDLF